MTYTVAELEVSPEAYDEIAGKLKAAGYHHAFMPDGTIDMAGIGLVKPLLINEEALVDVSLPAPPEPMTRDDVLAIISRKH